MKALALILALFGAADLIAQTALSARPEDQPNTDQRWEAPRDLDSYFPFTPPDTLTQWQQRSGEVRTNLLVALGLFPMPMRHPLHTVIHGLRDDGDYTVEKVYFQSLPGFYVTGSLYRPKGRTGLLPAVLCPHGHWPNGRFMQKPENEVREAIASGAESMTNAASNILQARCVQLARMGCVTFLYDMIGYADSVQIPMEVAHGFAKQRPELSALNHWGLFSAQAEMRSQSVMGLQAWNSIRALDFLCSLPEVDATRVGVTGESGGGTQTFILGAIDPRPAAVFPAVMVGTAMQGGCTCENASNLRVDTGNVEIAALFAPKPLGMTGANDWTKETLTKGYPQLQQLYQILGAPKNVQLTSLTQFPHNYNQPSRMAMYHWFNEHLKLGVNEPIQERDFKLLTSTELTVWDKDHPAPAGGPDFEAKLLRDMDEDSRQQVKKLTAAELLVAWRSLIGRSYEKAGEVEWVANRKIDKGDYFVISGLFKNLTYHEEIPAIFFYPKNYKGDVHIDLNKEGKAVFASDAESAKESLKDYLAAGVAVAAIDLFGQGESSVPGATNGPVRLVANPRQAPAYTFGYNRTAFARRVHDVLSVVHHIRTDKSHPVNSVELGASAGAEHYAAAALALAGGAIDKSLVAVTDFRFASVVDYKSPDFLPGAIKYGDIPGLQAVALNPRAAASKPH